MDEYFDDEPIIVESVQPPITETIAENTEVKNGIKRSGRKSVKVKKNEQEQLLIQTEVVEEEEPKETKRIVERKFSKKFDAPTLQTVSTDFENIVEKNSNVEEQMVSIVEEEYDDGPVIIVENTFLKEENELNSVTEPLQMEALIHEDGYENLLQNDTDIVQTEIIPQKNNVSTEENNDNIVAENIIPLEMIEPITEDEYIDLGLEQLSKATELDEFIQICSSFPLLSTTSVQQWLSQFSQKWSSLIESVCQNDDDVEIQQMLQKISSLQQLVEEPFSFKKEVDEILLHLKHCLENFKSEKESVFQEAEELLKKDVKDRSSFIDIFSSIIEKLDKYPSLNSIKSSIVNIISEEQEKAEIKNRIQQLIQLDAPSEPTLTTAISILSTIHSKGYSLLEEEEHLQSVIQLQQRFVEVEQILQEFLSSKHIDLYEKIFNLEKIPLEKLDSFAAATILYNNQQNAIQRIQQEFLSLSLNYNQMEQFIQNYAFLFDQKKLDLLKDEYVNRLESNLIESCKSSLESVEKHNLKVRIHEFLDLNSTNKRILEDFLQQFELEELKIKEAQLDQERMLLEEKEPIYSETTIDNMLIEKIHTEGSNLTNANDCSLSDLVSSQEQNAESQIIDSTLNSISVSENLQDFIVVAPLKESNISPAQEEVRENDIETQINASTVEEDIAVQNSTPFVLESSSIVSSEASIEKETVIIDNNNTLHISSTIVQMPISNIIPESVEENSSYRTIHRKDLQKPSQQLISNRPERKKHLLEMLPVRDQIKHQFSERQNRSLSSPSLVDDQYGSLLLEDYSSRKVATSANDSSQLYKRTRTMSLFPSSQNQFSRPAKASSGKPLEKPIVDAGPKQRRFSGSFSLPQASKIVDESAAFSDGDSDIADVLSAENSQREKMIQSLKKTQDKPQRGERLRKTIYKKLEQSTSPPRRESVVVAPVIPIVESSQTLPSETVQVREQESKSVSTVSLEKKVEDIHPLIEKLLSTTKILVSLSEDRAITKLEKQFLDFKQQLLQLLRDRLKNRFLLFGKRSVMDFFEENPLFDVSDAVYQFRIRKIKDFLYPSPTQQQQISEEEVFVDFLLDQGVFVKYVNSTLKTQPVYMQTCYDNKSVFHLQSQQEYLSEWFKLVSKVKFSLGFPVILFEKGLICLEKSVAEMQKLALLQSSYVSDMQFNIFGQHFCPQLELLWTYDIPIQFIVQSGEALKYHIFEVVQLAAEVHSAVCDGQEDGYTLRHALQDVERYTKTMVFKTKKYEFQTKFALFLAFALNHKRSNKFFEQIFLDKRLLKKFCREEAVLKRESIQKQMQTILSRLDGITFQFKVLEILALFSNKYF